MSPIYTKTFGGKIWKKLHSVSPDNFFQKNFNEVTLQNIFTAKKFSRVTEKTIPPKNFWTISLQKKQLSCHTKHNCGFLFANKSLPISLILNDLNDIFGERWYKSFSKKMK